MKHCLIVEPNRMIRAVLRNIMTDLHFDCVQTGDSESALAAAQQQPPAVVLLEWELGSQSGLDLLQALRSAKGVQPIIVFCAAQSDPAIIAQALDAGADDFIMKPFDAEIVRAKLEQLGCLG